MLNKDKLQHIAEQVAICENKIADKESELAMLRQIKLNLEIEFEDGLLGVPSDEELLTQCVVWVFFCEQIQNVSAYIWPRPNFVKKIT